MKRVAYELLVRHDIMTGEVRGAHVKFYDWMTDADGNIINGSGKDSDAMSLTTAAALDFPLTAILSQIEVGALLAMEQAQDELITEKVAHAATQEELAATKAELAAALKAE